MNGNYLIIYMTADIFAQLENLYKELPDVQCQGCGLCCVSPSCTLVEFLYAMNGAKKILSGDDLKAFLTQKPEIHPEYEGNLRCIFLKNSRCLIHAARSGACRLFGVPSLLQMGIADMVECRNNIKASGNASAEFIRAWIDRLVDLNRNIFPIAEEPFFLTGLNIESWLDIYFDATHTLEFLKNLRPIMLEYLDLNELTSIWKDRTHIRDKMEKIDAFTSFIHIGAGNTLKGVLLSIRDDYPFTGTYFLAEADKYLKRIDEEMGKNK
jgi:hypothetical protein